MGRQGALLLNAEQQGLLETQDGLGAAPVPLPCLQLLPFPTSRVSLPVGRPQGRDRASPGPCSTGRPCRPQGELGLPSPAGGDGGQTSLALTSGYVHGVEASQQVTAPLAVAFHLAQPAVAVEEVTEVRPIRVGHNHAV